MYSQQIFKKFYIKTDINQHDDKFSTYTIFFIFFWFYFLFFYLSLFTYLQNVFVNTVGMILIKERCYRLVVEKKLSYNNTNQRFSCQCTGIQRYFQRTIYPTFLSRSVCVFFFTRQVKRYITMNRHIKYIHTLYIYAYTFFLLYVPT